MSLQTSASFPYTPQPIPSNTPSYVHPPNPTNPNENQPTFNTQTQMNQPNPSKALFNPNPPRQIPFNISQMAKNSRQSTTKAKDASIMGWQSLFQRLSNKEFQSKIVKGLCFQCDEQFKLNHRCQNCQLHNFWLVKRMRRSSCLVGRKNVQTQIKISI